MAEYKLGKDKLIADCIVVMYECGRFIKRKDPHSDRTTAAISLGEGSHHPHGGCRRGWHRRFIADCGPVDELNAKLCAEGERPPSRQITGTVASPTPPRLQKLFRNFAAEISKTSRLGLPSAIKRKRLLVWSRQMKFLAVQAEEMLIDFKMPQGRFS